jgi:beta-lactamase regulating signal transducer with metallopeptidase domain
MEMLDFARAYLAANCVLLLAWLLLTAARRFTRTPQAIPVRAQLAFGYAALLIALLMPSLAIFAGHDYLPQAAQIWSAPTMRADAFPLDASHMTLTFAPTATTIGLDRFASVSSAILLSTGAIALLRILFGMLSALRLIRASHLVRRRDSLWIMASDAIEVPFSFWIPGRHYIALPAALLASPQDLRFALRHEAQHHRHGDTKLLYGMQFVLGMCFWNPAAHRFVRAMRELQELVCDEAIVQRPRVSSLAYCQCLVRIAEQIGVRRAALVCMGMADDARASVFLQRIEHLMQRPTQTMQGTKLVGLAVAGLAMLSLAAVTLAASVKDRRITHEDAQRMAEVARADSGFPIVVNDSVVQELNRYLGTPDGRKFVRDGLDRMQAHRELLDAKLMQYGLPKELVAVPLIESGYRNLQPSARVGQGAGLWMFIAPTARQYALRVDAQADERLNVAAETDAAMRMFADLQQRFGDWNLALLAYNAGHAIVERGIRETGSSDAWTIVGQGYENDHGYLSRVMAAILIMRNPEYVR